MKKPPISGGSVHCGGEQFSPSKSRPILKAPEAAKLHLQALLWSAWLQGGYRP